jgi:hypothetical protein
VIVFVFLWRSPAKRCPFLREGEREGEREREKGEMEIDI